MAGIWREEGRRIVALISDGRAAIAAMALTFLVEVLVGLRIFIASMDLLSFIIVIVPMLVEGLLWLTALMIASGTAYYSARDGKGALPSTLDAIFKMVRFNYPRQLLYVAGFLAIPLFNTPAGTPWDRFIVNASLIAVFLLLVNLALALVFALIGRVIGGLFGGQRK